jgi:TRAP-type C4-dicarboxylate transport system permease small subunit
MDTDAKPGSFVLIDYLAKGAEFVMVTLTFLMIVLVTYQVFERYVLHYTPPWSEELAVYSMIWFGMLGIAIGVRTKSHMSLHFFADKLPSGIQKILELVKFVLILTYVSVLIYEGINMVQLTMAQKSPAMGIPVGFVYLALPVSAVLIVIFTLESLVQFITRWRHE